MDVDCVLEFSFDRLTFISVDIEHVASQSLG